MKRNKSGALTPFYDANDLLHFVPQLQDLAKISIIKLANMDSTNIDPLFWTLLAKTIEKEESEYDGFVIAHGTDTMAYTASAISFALQKIKKPVVFTGAQKPIQDIPSDAVPNLLNSTVVASKFALGVCIVFGSKILQGNRATKMSESSLDAFDSPMVAPIGKISLDPQIGDNYNLSKKKSDYFHKEFDPNVLVVQLVPGIQKKYLESIIELDIHGIIFEAFGPGNIPKQLLPFLHQAEKRDIPIIILSQCRQGITRMQLYEVGREALAAGAIPGSDMTVESASTKLMWILSQTRDIRKIRNLYKKNISGEMSIYEQ